MQWEGKSFEIVFGTALKRNYVRFNICSQIHLKNKYVFA